MLFLETGRVVRPAPVEAPQTEIPTTVPTVSAQPEAPAQAVFAEADAALVEVNSHCGYEANVSAMIQNPLNWDLMQQAPTVLIVHSHGSESYEKTEDYEETSNYRTLNTDYNMISIGEELKNVLEAGGIRVLHDTTMHDQPSYSASYSHSRKSVKKYLEEYPSICMVLDLHRDAVENSKGKQVKFTAKKDGKTAAQLMLVVGTDVRLSHPDWPENMSLAVKLHAQLEKAFPGICRPISFRSQRFNQDLSPGALLIEVGSAGNTRAEALAAARVLGDAVLALAKGATICE
jgi:stage II sporulation protein P